MENTALTITEIKAGVRKVRDPDYWGAPYGTPITAGMREALKHGGRAGVRRYLREQKKPGKKTPSVSSGRRTGGTGKTTADSPRTVRTRTQGPAVFDRATGLLRAWGAAEDAPDVVRKNVKSDYVVEYVSKAELDKARKLAIGRSLRVIQPDKNDIAFTKHIVKSGGPGSKGSVRAENMDKLRGDMYMRSARSWSVYVAFGGISPRGKDKGYVPCLGCGIKMTWHNDTAFTNYPKFEHDKIIVTGDGGLYHSGNVIPMCAGCNNQRGSKKLWESQAFRGSRPRWYAAHEALVKRTRPSATVGQNRPANEVFPNVMPVPPGKARIRTQSKSQFDIIRRTEDIWKTTDKVVVDESASNGDRVSAHLWNFDGRHDDIEAGVFPPDVDDSNRTVVGILTMETVDSPFGSYDRCLVIEDDGLISFVEPETIEQVAPAPDFHDKETFNDETTNGGGGGGGGRGRLDGRASRRVRNVSAGTKANQLLGALETKGRLRRVRTAAGVAKYGLPIGSVITRDIIEMNFAASGKKKRREVFRGIPNNVRTTDEIAKPRKAELDKFWKRSGVSRDWYLDGIKHDAFANRGSRFAPISGTGSRVSIQQKPDGKVLVMIVPNGAVAVEETFYAASPEEAVDYMAALVQRRYARRNVVSNTADPDGKWHVNRRERDTQDTLWGYYEGIRGVDWSFDDDDQYGESEADRQGLIDKEAAELGYQWGANSHKIGLWAKEMMNSVMRAHEQMYPGFAQLHDQIIADDQAVAWNGRTINPWSNKQHITLAMNPVYFREYPDDIKVGGLMYASKRLEEGAAFNGVDMQKLSDETGLDKYNTTLLNIMTHELGHTVGNILQSRLWQDGKVEPGQGHNQSEEHTSWAAYEYRDRMMDMLIEYGAIDEDSVAHLSFDEVSDMLDKGTMPSTFDRQFFQDHVSGYGSTNFSEVMAEVWASYQLDTNPTDFVMDMGTLMEEALQTYLGDESGPRQKSAFDVFTNLERNF